MLRVTGKGREELVSEPSPPQEQSSALPVQWHREGPKVEAGLRTALERSRGAGQRAEPRALGPRRPYFWAPPPRAWWKRTSAGPPPGVQRRGRDPRVTSSKLCSSIMARGAGSRDLWGRPVSASRESESRTERQTLHQPQETRPGGRGTCCGRQGWASEGKARLRPVVPG